MSVRLVHVLRVTLAVAICAAMSPADGSPAKAESARNGEATTKKVGHPTFMSPHAKPIAINGNSVYVVNTPADTVDVIDRGTTKRMMSVKVGVDPVSIAVRPDGKEVWVSNHVSDSVSVIDTDPASSTCFQVVATIQEFDRQSKSTRFDEPVGIAFAGNTKAYVALSSENQIAVVDVRSRKITKRLTITAQEPRAIVVRGDRLYVIPFESNNKTQLSGGARDKIDGDLVTFDAWKHSIRVNNVLSLGHVVDIVKHPRVPDHDLYIFDTKTDQLVKVIDTLGTLLYGLTVDSNGRVFVAQADARNDANGRSGSKKHGLSELENRAFLNQVTRIATGKGSAKPGYFNLEPLPPSHPNPSDALATPFAIQVSVDDKTLFVTAAGSNKLFTVNADKGNVLGRVDVGAVPRGIALETESGKTTRAWVLNAVENSVSLVDVSKPSNLKVLDTVALEDPTHPAIKRGRIAFNTASASTTGTFSCASCHPDGHTDQLLWVLKTPTVTGGNQTMPRSTMPLRGLRDTEPYHWDGIPGDPYGGINSASIRAHVEPNSDRDDPTSSTRHLIDGGLATTMMKVGDKTVNDEGKAGLLSRQERDDLARFLLSVPFPPAQRRAFDNELSDEAEEGFRLFHIAGDHDPKQRTPNVCGNCHRMPFWVSTNTPGTGMDAPTWRGAYDRFLILPQGRLNIIDFDFYRRVAERGNTERSIWQFSWSGRRRFDPVWNMVLEGSTGYSGTFARQATLSKQTIKDELTTNLLHALERAASEGAVVLEAEGVIVEGKTSKAVNLQYIDGNYVSNSGDRQQFNYGELVTLASKGQFVGTFTGRHGDKATYDNPQPAIWTKGPIERQRGRQRFPILHRDQRRMTVSGRHVDSDAHVIVNGRRVDGSVHVEKDELVHIELAALPGNGMHLLQLQNPGGMFSNDFIFHVADDAKAAVALQRQIDSEHVARPSGLSGAIARGDLAAVNRQLDRGANVNARKRDGGSTPLSDAALHGRLEIAKLLLKRGAKVNGTNQDGNTPLHVAAFLCRTDIVKLLLDEGADPKIKNGRGETSIAVVSGEWNQSLADFYTGIGRSVQIKIDLKRMEKTRPQIAGLLRKRAKD